MGTLLGTTLVLFALGVLVYPFLNRRKYSMAADPSVERLRVARTRVYRQIADLEGDFRAGELTAADYESQMAELRLAAAKIMQSEDRLGVAESDVERLEREIAAARRAKAGPPEGGDRLK